MSKTSIHIDQLFAKGLENLEIPVSSNNFDTIKKDVGENTTSSNAFENFEIPVNDADWQMIKAKLAIVQAMGNQNTLETHLKEIEIPVTNLDWKGIAARLEKETNRTVVLLPTEYAKDAFKDFEIAVTDSDWQATKDKLENGKKKKLVWWYWLNIVVIGALIGVAVHYFAPINKTSSSLSILDNVYSKGAFNIPMTKEIEPKRITPLKKEITPSEPITKTSEPITKTYGKVNKISARENKTILSSKRVQAEQNEVTKLDKLTSNKSTLVNPLLKEETLPDVTEPASINVYNKVAKVATPSTIIPLIAKEIAPSLIQNETQQTETEIHTVSEKPVEDAEVNKGTGGSVADVVPTDSSKKKEDQTKIKKPPFKLPLNYFAGIGTDFVYTSRHLSSTNPSSYNNIRNNADKPSIQMAIGFVAGMQKGHSQFQSGFQYTEQRFSSNYSYVLQIQDSLEVWNPGRTVLIGKFPIGDKRDTTISGSQQLTIKKINIPFNYNYFWYLNTKTQLITGISGILGINVKASGTRMLNPANNQLYHYSYLKNAEQKFAFSPSMNIGLQRKLNSNIVLQTNIYGCYSVTNRYDTDFSAKQYAYSNNSSKFNAKEYLYGYGLSIKLLYLLH